jgi:tetratricopeptide (TPR) repeat protein
MIEKLMKCSDKKYIIIAFAFFLGIIFAPKMDFKPENLYYNNEIKKESLYFDTKSLTSYIKENIKENDIILNCTHFSNNSDYQMILKYYFGDLYDKHQLKQFPSREKGIIDLWLLSNKKISTVADIKRPLLVPAKMRFNLIETFSGWYIYKSAFIISNRSKTEVTQRIISYKNFLQASYDQRNKKYTKAIGNYHLFLKADALQELAYNNMGIISIRTRQDKKAIDMFERAVTTNSNLNCAWINLAMVQHKLGVLNNDEELLEKARDIIRERLGDLENKLVSKKIKKIIKSKEYQTNYPWQVATLDWYVPPGKVIKK